MANKEKRIEMLVKKNVSDIIQFEVKSKSIGFVTVTDCKMTKDYQYCRIYVSFLGTSHPENNLEALNNVKGFIRSSLAKKLDIWKIPNLEFVIDDSYEEGQRINELLKKDQESIDKMKK